MRRIAFHFFEFRFRVVVFSGDCRSTGSFPLLFELSFSDDLFWLSFSFYQLLLMIFRDQIAV